MITMYSQALVKEPYLISHPKHVLKLMGKTIFTILRFFVFFCLSKPVYSTSIISSHGKQGNVNYNVR